MPISDFIYTDYLILDVINLKKGDIGTVQLSKVIGIAPKQLLYRIEKLTKRSFLEKKSIPLKPQGWKRNWKLTEKGKAMMDAWMSYALKQKKMVDEFGE